MKYFQSIKTTCECKYDINWTIFDRPGYSLTTKKGLIQGKIKKYYGLNTELFSGLFEGTLGAGTAIVSVSPGTGSIHANVLFKGIAKEGQKNVNLVIKFHTTHGGETRSVEESVVLDLVGPVSLLVEIISINEHKTCLVAFRQMFYP